MFQTIVIGIDGRPQDEEAFALAKQLAGPGATLTATSVAVVREGVRGPWTSDGAAKMQGEAQEIVDRFVARHPGLDQIATSAPTAGQGLHNVAAGARADLIVVASSRRALPGRVWFGDAVRGVVEHAPCPVAVAAKDHVPAATLSTIAVADDGSLEADAATHLAQQLALRDGAAVRTVPLTSAAVITGVNTPALVEAEAESDLLVLGMRQHLSWDSAPGTEVAYALLRASVAPLLVVPTSGG